MTEQSQACPIVITGYSLVCSLGLNTNIACAAMRAGVVRPSSVNDFIVGDLDDSGGAIVHEAPLITFGLEGDARLLRLMQSALEGMQRQYPEAPWKDLRTYFYLSIPDPDRIYTGHALILDDDLRKKEIDEFKLIQKQRSEDIDVRSKAQKLLQKAAKLAGWLGSVYLKQVSIKGHTGVAEMMMSASHDLAANDVELAIVGGVDSWVDESSLLWLEQRGRLKSPVTPSGFQPGEAAGFLLIEAETRAKARQTCSLASLKTVILDEDKYPQLTAKNSNGEALARVVSYLMELLKAEGHSPLLVVDQNGEIYRAMEWGNTLPRLIQRYPSLQQPTLWYPVAAVGDTGSATGMIQISMVLHAFARNYAPTKDAMLLASAEMGQRAGVLLEMV